jgi:hypothetical protein
MPIDKRAEIHLTAKDLAAMGACSTGIARFMMVFPEGVRTKWCKEVECILVQIFPRTWLDWITRRPPPPI